MSVPEERQDETLEAIAGVFGVAASTVSRALAGKPGVSEAKREAIREYAEQLGFTPDRKASSLRTGLSTELTIITQPNPTEITAYRNHALFSFGNQKFGEVRITVQNGGESLESLIRENIKRKSRGIIISGIQEKVSADTVQLARSRSVPIVTLNADIQGFDSVVIDRNAGAYQAARLLILSGCRKPLFFTRNLPEIPDSRLDGIRRGLRSLKVEPSNALLLTIPDSEPQVGYDTARGLFSDNVPEESTPDGIFCYNDLVAIGVLKAAFDAGLRVPEDVRIIGFDNLKVTPFLGTPLTTVSQPVRECAGEALDMIERRSADPELPRQVKAFATELVIRKSAPLPRGMNEINFR